MPSVCSRPPVPPICARPLVCAFIVLSWSDVSLKYQLYQVVKTQVQQLGHRELTKQILNRSCETIPGENLNGHLFHLCNLCSSYILWTSTRPCALILPPLQGKFTNPVKFQIKICLLPAKGWGTRIRNLPFHFLAGSIVLALGSCNNLRCSLRLRGL